MCGIASVSAIEGGYVATDTTLNIECRSLALYLAAGPMQAPGLFSTADPRGKYGLVHNIGIGGAVVCSLLRRPEVYKPGGQTGQDRCVAQYSQTMRSTLTGR